MDWTPVPRDVEQLLRAYRFDEARFDELRERLRSGAMGNDRNRITGRVEAPDDRSLQALPSEGTSERREMEREGQRAIDAGRVGVVVLNGGMATRFGGVVKSAVAVIGDRSFLDLKLSDVRIAGRGRVPVFLMNSFATHERTQILLAALGPEREVRCFTQSVMLRVTAEAELYLDAERRPSPYAPGHGDLTDSLRASGSLEGFVAGGGELLLMSNVDNLGATLDPAVIGAHLALGGAMTVELVDKEPGDKGGAPALVDGKLQIVEEFRFPTSFDQDTIPVFNTNTFVFDARALARDFPLTWFAVKKRVEGVDLVQFERLAGELTSWLDARYLRVPRGGRAGRFLPVKDPAELERRRSNIVDVMRSRRVVE
jgi:UTP--glucose-1-phosphate uridylyltransferase